MFDKTYSIEKDLLKKEKIDKNFLKRINFLTIEEIISLKLITASRGLNGKLYNFPIYKYTSDIVKEACLNFALTVSNSKKEAAMILGIPKVELNRLIKLYKINSEKK